MAHSHFTDDEFLHEPLEDDYDREAASALRLFQMDIWSMYTSTHPKWPDYSIALSLQRSASQWSAKAFSARGTFDHPAWVGLVTDVDALLHHCSVSGEPRDDGARDRLVAFVQENQVA